MYYSTTRRILVGKHQHDASGAVSIGFHALAKFLGFWVVFLFLFLGFFNIYYHSYYFSCADEITISLTLQRVPYYFSYSYFRWSEQLINATEPAMQAYKVNDLAHPKSQGNVSMEFWLGIKKSLSIPELELTALLSGYQSLQLTFMQSQCIYEEEVHDPEHYLFYFKHQCTSILWIIQDILNFNVWLRSGSKIIMFKIQTEAVLEGIVRGRDNLWINECITKDFIIILFLYILITRIW